MTVNLRLSLSAQLFQLCLTGSLLTLRRVKAQHLFLETLSFVVNKNQSSIVSRFSEYSPWKPGGASPRPWSEVHKVKTVSWEYEDIISLSPCWHLYCGRKWGWKSPDELPEPTPQNGCSRSLPLANASGDTEWSGVLMLWWCEWEILHLPWKTFWPFLIQLNVCLSYNLAARTHFHNHSSQKLETTQCLSVRKRINNGWYSHAVQHSSAIKTEKTTDMFDRVQNWKFPYLNYVSERHKCLTNVRPSYI